MVRKSPPRIVSPFAGIRGARQTRSMLIEPMTTIGPPLAGRDLLIDIPRLIIDRRPIPALAQRRDDRFAVLLHLERPHPLDLLELRQRIGRPPRDELERAVVTDAVRRKLLLAREVQAQRAQPLET